VNDGHQYGGCVTIPILSFECLLKLNRVIYHPSYNHQYSDAEFFNNIHQMNLVKDVRNGPIMFEHRHWACSKRGIDSIDTIINAYSAKDRTNYRNRLAISVQERLVVHDQDIHFHI